LCEYLKQNKIKYSTEPDNNHILYELFLGSISAFIQLDWDDKDDNVGIELYCFSTDYYGYLYERSISTDSNDEFFTEIEALLTATKNINKALSKIENKLEDIKAICEENEIELKSILNINYKF
jgi:hypothetical protein